MQASDVGEVTKLMVGRSIVDEFCDELVELFVIRDWQGGDVLRPSARCHGQDQYSC